MPRYIGKEMSRVDGVAKVTGRAKYAAEFKVPNVANAFLVMGTIAKGTIRSIDTAEASRAPGVIRVFTHENFPKLSASAFCGLDPATSTERMMNPFPALQSNRVLYNAQPIALVVAETFEQARYAARLVTATYDAEKSVSRVEDVLATAFVPPRRAPEPRGNPVEALAAAPVKVEAVYTIPMEHHNPMEPHGAIAYWEGDTLTIFDKTQGVNVVRQHLAAAFGIPADSVHVTSPFVGGAFGASLRPNYYPALVAAAAREIKRPVKLVYTRTQMFTGHGYRPYTWQKVALGAERNGKLTAIIHKAVKNASTFKDWTDGTTEFARSLYACPNADTPNLIVKTDLSTPESMRAPGAVSGVFALECAMDELAYALKMDPLELRLVNYTDVHPDSGLPYSSKALRECYRLGAEKFGWSKRTPEPRSMRDGRLLVGWGMATGVWGAFQQPASASVTLRADGTARVTSATSDIGPGTYTVMTLIAAEYLGLDAEKVRFELGDTKFPQAPVQGGSFTTASVGTAIYGATQSIKAKLLELANKDTGSPLRSAEPEDVELLDGRLQSKTDRTRSVIVADVMRRNGVTELVDVHDAKPSPERENYATGAHGAQFVEVKVDPSLGTVQVTRVIEVSACGKIMNPKTSHSQELGGIVWGIGMALQEATEVDHRYGRIMNPNLQHYHVPVNADVLNYETIFVEEEDTIVNPLGVKGMGELGLVGIPAAIANAVFHATGKRIRDLPITPDKLL